MEVVGFGTWKGGQWTVIMTRPLVTQDEADVRFTPGESALVNFAVWDGGWLGIIFLALAAFLVHHFWTDEGMERVGQQVHFLKNLALAAALLLVTYLPKEAWTIALGP